MRIAEGAIVMNARHGIAQLKSGGDRIESPKVSIDCGGDNG